MKKYKLVMPVLCAVLISGCFSLFARNMNFKSFAYILQVTNRFGLTRADRLNSIRSLDRELIILDYSENGDKESKWKKSELSFLKNHGKTKVVAYLSIGEAENYRNYWGADWKVNSPAFLCAENENWKGNYKVRYWDKEWQKIIFNYLDEIIEQGFDGVYLDIIDAFSFFEYDKDKKDWVDNKVNFMTNQTYRKDMIDFVIKIAEYARKKNSNFLIIPQNGTELLNNEEYLNTITTVGVESLFSRDNRKQRPGHTKQVLNNLNNLKEYGKTPLIIEYCNGYKIKRLLKDVSKKYPYTFLITDRQLKSAGESWSYFSEVKPEPPANVSGTL